MNIGDNFHKGAAFFVLWVKGQRHNVDASAWGITHLIYGSRFKATPFVGFSLLRLPSSAFFR
ncbi:hypothetical protein BDV41DRAFT_542805 [Aspergillus transmontanensis]|uniref:Uncharacterized protein n=1 Tax=Aspergillus transmontanensis TaxID=1034304 RepID=A0A5N6VRR8_9EURO|nr:hypothetical protein BDV41DRAFT_542805 [Aspergillus transmontanensis]